MIANFRVRKNRWTPRAVLTSPLQHHWAVFSGVCIKHGAITMISSMVMVGKKHTVIPLLLLS